MVPGLTWFLPRWRWFAGAGVLVLLYALAGFFLVPRLARGAIEDFVTQQIGKQVAIERIEFNPFLLAARVTGFRLTEPDDRPLVAFDELFVNVQVSTLWNRALTFAEIRLTQPAIDAVIQPDGALNLTGLVPPSTESAEAAEPAAPTPLPAIRIGLLQVSSGRIGIEDQTRATPFHATITPIQFSLNEFRTTVDYQNAYRFAGTTEAGEQLEWAGEFTVQPLGSTGNFSVTGLKAGTLWSYVRDDVQFMFPSGSLSLGGTYRLAVTEDNQIDLGIDLPEVRLSDYTIAPKGTDTPTPWISIPELVLRQTSLSLRDRHVSVQEFALNGARIDVWREADGTINLSRLTGSTASTEPAAGNATAVTTNAGPVSATSPSTPAWQAEIASVAIRDLAINASDRSMDPAVDIVLSPISLTLTGLTSDLKKTFDLAAAVGINQTGLLKVQGKLRPEALLADLDVELTDFGLPVLQPYLAQTTAMTLGSGRFGLKGHVNYAADAARPQPQLKFTGRVDVADLASKDTVLNEDFLKWKLLSVTGIDYSFQPDRLTIDRVLARDPYARVIIGKDAKLNVTQVLKPGAEDEEDRGQGTADSAKSPPSGAQPKAQSQKPTAAAPIEPVMPMRINTVVVENGSANFADFSVNPSFATGIQSLGGTIRGLSSNPDTRAKVDLKGSVDRFSPVVIAGEVNLLSAALYTDIAMSFSNMELTTFNPYSGKFAGYAIAKGKLSTELKYKVQDRALEAEHHVVIDQLEFGAATESKDAVPLPIKLAVSLLKDRNGVIDINLPVRGTLDDPTFRLGPIIWKAVIGLLTKIVTAPFALLGSLFGGGEDLAFVDFAPGAAILTPDSAQKLTTLTKALIERPQLKLDIPLSVHTPVDEEAMARAALAQKVPEPAGSSDDVAVLQQRVLALTKAGATAATPPVPTAAAGSATPPAVPTPESLRAQIDELEKSLLTTLAPTADQLDTLARGRAEAVQGALLGSGEIAAERVFLTARPAADQSTATVVRMELKLE